MKELSVAVLGGGRWARALSVVLAHNQLKGKGRIGRVMQYRQPSSGKAQSAQSGRLSRDRLSVSQGLGSMPGDDATVQMSASALLNAAGEVYADQCELSEIIEADLLVLAVQARSVRQLLRAARRYLRADQLLVHSIGSFAPNEIDRESSGALISDVILEETPIRRVGALSGPALAEDLEEGSPAALLCGCLSDDIGQAVRQVMVCPTLRVYQSHDLVGVEVARATVSIVALAAGVAEALEFGASARAMLVARGAAEMSQIGLVLGGNDRTFLGLAGVGELVVATERRGSADFQLGQLIGRGVPLGDALRQISRVCDGPTMAREAYLIAQRFGLRVPISSFLYNWLGGRLDLRTGLEHLLEDESYVE
jgi:glycerol-3-phosphate dehydrogenase (NAD(P)+)